MAGDLPDYYFRIRENGATVFKVDSENRQRRIEMQEIAVVNVRNGNIRPHGERKLAPEDLTAITEWMAARQATLAARDLDEIRISAEKAGKRARRLDNFDFEELAPTDPTPIIGPRAAE